jgi:hypothetical protein
MDAVCISIEFRRVLGDQQIKLILRICFSDSQV